eukprot:354917-Chlamydomonas_euryale.AAC.26
MPAPTAPSVIKCTLGHARAHRAKRYKVHTRPCPHPPRLHMASRVPCQRRHDVTGPGASMQQGRP